MSNLRKIPENELNKLSKDAIIMLFLQLSDSFEMQSHQLDILQKQNEKLSSQISNLQESIAVLTQQRFGRKTEKTNTFTTYGVWLGAVADRREIRDSSPDQWPL